MLLRRKHCTVVSFLFSVFIAATAVLAQTREESLDDALRAITRRAIGAMLAPATEEKGGVKRRIVYNDDATGLAEAGAAMDPEKYFREFIRREVSCVPITTFSFLAAFPDVCLYDTKVGEAYGARHGFKGESWSAAINALRLKGSDSLRVVIDELRPRGFEILAAVRMNDTHHTRLDANNPSVPKFALDHPEFVIKQPDGRTNETALDYSFPEVRAHRLAILRELAEKYDIDGLELDFCRWAKHFPRDKGREKSPLMTEFMGQVRKTLDEAAKKRGRSRFTLGVRVPESIEACWLAGVDPKTWVANGWLDYLVVSAWNNTDLELPVEQFAAFTRGTNCQLLAMMGNMIGTISSKGPRVVGRGVNQIEKRPGYTGLLLSTPEARACAANFYAWGAEGIYFWNIACNMGENYKFVGTQQRNRMWAWMNATVDPKKVYDGPRQYHYLPFYKDISARRPPQRNYPWYDEGRSTLGAKARQSLTFTDGDIDRRKTYPFRMADGRNGEKLKGLLRFWIYHITGADRIAVDINGRKIDGGKIKRAPAGEKMRLGPAGECFEIDLGDCPPFRGDNELGLILQNKVQGSTTPLMDELEILVE